MHKLDEIRGFLGTNSLNYIFTDKGLKYLSLRKRQDEQVLNLDLLRREDEFTQTESLIISETISFLQTGRHQLPLDLSELTGFQQEVFQIVSNIEPGRTMTYKAVAEMLGKPGAAQAVGSAIAKNPVSYFLPTHRVLPQKGIGICRTGAGHLREKLLVHEGHDLDSLRGNYFCKRKKCVLEEY